MADAISVLGAGLGAASLILQVTDECIKMYHYFTEASRMPESLRYLRVRLQMEQQRFLGFASEAGLLFADGRLCATLQVNQTVLQAVLVEVKTAMEAFEEIQEKYNQHPIKNDALGDKWANYDDHGEPRTNLVDLLCIGQRREATLTVQSEAQINRSSRFGRITSAGGRIVDGSRKLRVILAEPKRLMWAAVDQKSLHNLLAKLESLNTFLIAMLDTYQIAKLETTIEKSYVEMLQLRDDLKRLDGLVRALKSYGENNFNELPSISHPHGDSNDASLGACARMDWRNREYLERLAIIKMNNIQIDRGDITTFREAHKSLRTDQFDLLLDMSCVLEQLALDKFGSRIMPKEHSLFPWGDRNVWIEWVSSPSSFQVISRPRNSERRVSLLAGLLCNKLPPSFRAPSCLGYIRSVNHEVDVSFGLVFQAPASGQSLHLASLRQVLGKYPKPSLSMRIALSSALADCVQSFHLVDWLHKGLQSSSIIFMLSNTSSFDPSNPYVTGFKLSRPDDETDMTLEPDTDLLSDLYRHPWTQSGERRRYRKCYDLYSLGVILLEIIYWQPIEDILQLQPSKMSVKAVRDVKNRLMGRLKPDNCKAEPSQVGGTSQYLRKAAQLGGDVYQDILEICLAADEIEKPIYKGEPKLAVCHRLQVVFEEQVVQKLRVMNHALQGSG